MTTYGQGATRTAALYGAGVAALLPFGLVTLAVTTRYLGPTDYGRLATVFAVASILTLLAGLAVIQGTIMLVYRGGDDGSDGVDAVSEAGVDQLDPYDEETPSVEEGQRLLGSGLLLAALQATVVAGAALAAAPLLAALVLGDSSWADSIRWMALCVWTGSIWRMVHQIWRLERRPVVWVGYQLLRPLLVVGGTLALFAAGERINGPLIATGLGTGVAIVISLTASRHTFRLRPKVSDAVEIIDAGKIYVLLVLSAVVQTNLSVLLVAALANPSSVGLYQVAARIAQIPAYFADGFFMTWPMMDRSPIGWAARARKGNREHAAAVFTLLCLGTLGLLVFVSLGANGLIQIASPQYAAAADLIPIVAAGGVSHVVFRGIYRASRFPRRRAWFIALHFIWIVPYVGTVVALSEFGATWAVASGSVVAYTVAALGMYLLDRRGPMPTPFGWARLGLALAGSAATVAAVEISGTTGLARFATVLVALVAFPTLLFGLRVVPRDQLAMVMAILRGVLPERLTKRTVQARFDAIPRHERTALASIVWARHPVEQVAANEGTVPAVALARMVRALRRLGPGGRPSPHDAVIGRYLLLQGGSILERDAIARELAIDGVDPLELHRLDGAMTRIKRLRTRARRWHM